MQLARVVKSVHKNLDEKWLTGEVFLDVAKGFDTEWFKGFLYKPTIQNFPSYLVKPYLHYRTSFQSVTSTRNMRAGVTQG
jgi:hypothetical protein